VPVDYSPYSPPSGLETRAPPSRTEIITVRLDPGEKLGVKWRGTAAGQIVAAEVKEGPAAAAGLRSGSRLLATDGRPVEDREALLRALADLKARGVARWMVKAPRGSSPHRRTGQRSHTRQSAVAAQWSRDQAAHFAMWQAQMQAAAAAATWGAGHRHRGDVVGWGPWSAGVPGGYYYPQMVPHPHIRGRR